MFDPDKEYNLTTERLSGYVFAYARAVSLTPGRVRGLLADLRRALIYAGSARLLFQCDIAFSITDDEVLAIMGQWKDALTGFRVAFISTDPRHTASLSWRPHLGGSLARSTRHLLTRTKLVSGCFSRNNAARYNCVHTVTWAGVIFIPSLA